MDVQTREIIVTPLSTCQDERRRARTSDDSLSFVRRNSFTCTSRKVVPNRQAGYGRGYLDLGAISGDVWAASRKGNASKSCCTFVTFQHCLSHASSLLKLSPNYSATMEDVSTLAEQAGEISGRERRLQLSCGECRLRKVNLSIHRDAHLED